MPRSTTPSEPVDGQVPARLVAKIAVDDTTGCWEWLGHLVTGYGVVWWEGRDQYAHRVVYTLLAGPIPTGLDLDHTCHTAAVALGQCDGGRSCIHRRCVNPLHCEPVTRQENITRGMAPVLRRAISHCPHGHEYSDQNTYIRPSGSRECRTCRKGKVPA